MKLKIFNCLLPILFFFYGNTQTISKQEFLAPARDYAPMTWWHWVNGNITKDGIRKDLIALDNAGMRGVQVFNAHMYLPEGPIEYGTEKWFDMMAYALHVCDSLGLKFTMMNSAGWSGAGGPWISPEQAMKKLVFKELKVTGGKTHRINLPKPTAVGNYLEDIALLAIPASYSAGQIDNLDSKIMMGEHALYLSQQIQEKDAIPHNQIVDLTGNVDSKRVLSWDAPLGEWTVIRFCYTLTGKKNHPAAYGGEGYEVDKLDSEHVEYQFQQGVGKFLDKIKDSRNSTFEGILFDSYEAHYQNWTKKLPEEFSKKYGYSLIDFLPLFTGRYVDSVEKSEKVLTDFRCLLDNLLASNFYGTMQQLAHKNGLVTYTEAQGGPVNSSLAVNFVDIQMNEFWNPDAKNRLQKMKYTSSLAAARGKNLVGAESFTSTPDNGKWKNTPWSMKRPGDMAFASGINRFCFHTFVHQPLDYAVPGFTMGRYGTLFSRHLTWWNMADEWITYLTRSQYLLQQGKRVSDICFLFNKEIRYGFPTKIAEMPFGYDFSVIYPEDLLNAYVVKGELVLKSGLKFNAVILPLDVAVEPETAEAVMSLVRKGIKLIWLKTGATQMVRNEGSGKVIISDKMEPALSNAAIKPDIQSGSKEVQGSIYFTHRETENEHIYFLSNQSDKSFKSELSFNVNGMVPELWDQSNGQVSDLSYKMVENSVVTQLAFDSYGSFFVIFNKHRKAKKQEAFKPEAGFESSPLPIEGPWKLDFNAKKQMGESVDLNKLVSLHLLPDDRVKYYSGTMNYSTSFTVNLHSASNAGIVLDLGEIYDIAEIFVNGEKVGTLWKKPYQIDITPKVRNGKNELKVVVVNTWCNRLIGDEQLKPEVEYDFNGTIFNNGRLAKYPEWLYSGSKHDSLKRHTFTTWKHYDKDSKLLPAGLVGPVKILQSIEKK